MTMYDDVCNELQDIWDVEGTNLFLFLDFEYIIKVKIHHYNTVCDFIKNRDVHALKLKKNPILHQATPLCDNSLGYSKNNLKTMTIFLKI